MASDILNIANRIQGSPGAQQPMSVLGDGSSQSGAAVSSSTSSGQETQDSVERPKPVDMESLQGMVDQINDAIKAKNLNLSFSVHEETGIRLIKVFDTDSKELVRQFPPEEILSAAEQIVRMISSGEVDAGAIFSDSA